MYFLSIVTNLALQPTPRLSEDLCIHCDLCVKNCPGGALDDEGKTDLMKCMKHSLPYGIGADIGFWAKLLNSSPEGQREMPMNNTQGFGNLWYWETSINVLTA